MHCPSCTAPVLVPGDRTGPAAALCRGGLTGARGAARPGRQTDAVQGRARSIAATVTGAGMRWVGVPWPPIDPRAPGPCTVDQAQSSRTRLPAPQLLTAEPDQEHSLWRDAHNGLAANVRAESQPVHRQNSREDEPRLHLVVSGCWTAAWWQSSCAVLQSKGSLTAGQPVQAKLPGISSMLHLAQGYMLSALTQCLEQQPGRCKSQLCCTRPYSCVACNPQVHPQRPPRSQT